MADQRTATVVGGGIAGLAAAASLLQAGWRVTVLERAPAFGEVGAGLSITRNGMSALDAIGVGASVRESGHPTVTAGTHTLDGQWLMRFADPGPEAPFRIWGIHRRDLHSALLEAAADAVLITDARVVHVDPGAAGSGRARVTWRADGQERTSESDLVIAADGIRSPIRHQLFAIPRTRLRYSGFTSWRAIVDDTGSDDDGFAMHWGPSAEFGRLRINDRQIYWYGYFRHPEGASFADELGAARERFAEWTPEVLETIEATAPEGLLRHDVYDLTPGLPTYVRGRAAIIGDAAHAMLPTMGQGANTALEDGVCVGRIIAQAIDGGGDLAGALRTFDRARRPRCRTIARNSRMTARIGAHLGGGLRQTLRNNILMRLPADPLARAGSAVLGWEPPGHPPRSSS